MCTGLLRRQLRTTDIGEADVPVLSAEVDDPAGFAECCERLLTDDALWREKQQAALEFVEQTASAKRFDKMLGDIVDVL